jgi:AcrR family transcriptional regulator
MGFKGRVRRSADEARELILDAAEAQLVKHGPDSLRLVQLAEELGISHPAILHHFGSREGLVRAVVTRTAARIERQVFESLRGDMGEADAVQLLERIFRALADEGHARLLLWLYLSGHADPVGYGSKMRNIADTIHALRRTHRPNADPDDTLFTVLLAGMTLFGNAVVGGPMRQSAGLPDNDAENARFVAWFARLLHDHLER